jgi:photosystem II stability/assembly factor-like uncharacterized protein
MPDFTRARQTNSWFRYVFAITQLLALSNPYAAEPGATETTTLSALQRTTPIHGLAVQRQGPDLLYLATHRGLFAIAADGLARRMSVRHDNFVKLRRHPTDPGILYASAYAAGNGNLEFIMSADGGKTWQRLAVVQATAVDVHSWAISPVDPNIIYAVFGGLQISRDGGRSWQISGKVPDRSVDLAASAIDAARLYAATEQGLFVTLDRGQTWQSAYMPGRAAAMVQTTKLGKLYAIVKGAGLIRGTEPTLRWVSLSNDFGDARIMDLAIDPGNADNFYALTASGNVLSSTDGGRTWTMFGVR